MAKEKVMVAMSGGVDSSVAAALLKERGYDVFGVTLQIWPKERMDEEPSGSATCCSLSAVEDARRVAAKLEIPHYVLNFQDVFQKLVIEDFCMEYKRGRTPNPCVRCNQRIKFEILLEKARALEMDFLATGHYARIVQDKESGRRQLLKGVDPQKDQSYMLYTMAQDQLASVLFPLGGYVKDETRKLAEERGMVTAQKPESQEICFVPDNDYGRFLEEYEQGAHQPGAILNAAGKVVGRHEGIHRFTIGQRKGIGISGPSPLYVLDIIPETHSIVVGQEEELYTCELKADEMNWISAVADIQGQGSRGKGQENAECGMQNAELHIKDRGGESSQNRKDTSDSFWLSSLPSKPTTDHRPLTTGLRVQAKIRYRMEAAPATVEPIGADEARIIFDKPQRAITPGQSVVLYQGDLVVGGGIIQRV